MILNKRASIFSTIIIVLIIALVASVPIGRLIMDNRTLEATIKNQQSKINSLQDEITSFSLENQLLMKENRDLTQENKDLIQVFNGKLEELRKEATIGTSRPKKVGFGPQFTLVSRGSVNPYSQQNILNSLSNGFYQQQQKEVFFDSEDCKSWTNLGDWFVSCYTATVGECDSNPSITASGSLVTPSFTVAVDNKFWKFGTIFYFEGLGFGVAADTGGAIKGKNRADFLVASKSYANLVSGKRKVYLVHTPD